MACLRFVPRALKIDGQAHLISIPVFNLRRTHPSTRASSPLSLLSYLNQNTPNTFDQLGTELSVVFVLLVDKMYHSMRVESSQEDNNSAYDPVYIYQMGEKDATEKWNCRLRVIML